MNLLQIILANIQIWKLLTPVMVIIIGIAASAIAQERIKSKKRQQHKKSIRIKEDDRPLILYLRSFSSDGVKVERFPSKWGYSYLLPIDSFEMKLAKQAERIGSFYAIGDPEKSEKEIGAVRENFADDEWHAVVLKRMEEAFIIIYRPSTNRWTKWEFEQIVANNYLDKTIIAIKKEEESMYDSFRQAFKKMLPDLPPVRSNEMYICFDEELKISKTRHIIDSIHFSKLIY